MFTHPLREDRACSGLRMLLFGGHQLFEPRGCLWSQLSVFSLSFRVKHLST